MIKIVEGNLEKLKAEMNLWKKAQQEKLRNVKKEYKGKYYPSSKLTELENMIKKYSFTKIQPVKIEGITIDYKLYTSFVKKLKKIPYSVKIQDNRLVVEYQDGRSKGMLTLYDISGRYKKLQHIPTAVFEEVSQ